PRRGAPAQRSASCPTRSAALALRVAATPQLAGGFNAMLSFQNCSRAVVQRGSVAWPICGLLIIVFGSGWTLNAAYTVVGAHTVSMKPTPCSDFPLNLRAKFTAS